MKKLVLVGILLIVILIGCIIASSFPNKISTFGISKRESASNSVVIILGQDEYTPNAVRIRKGQTVRFKNESNDWRWPASNSHPTHDIYPEFDPKEPIATGKSWTFQFDKPGVWNMHDHLAPYITGTITVLP